MTEPAASPITSRQNPLVKAARALDARKARRETGLFVAEGLEVIGMALAAGWPPERLFHRDGASTPLAAAAAGAGSIVHPSSAAVMAALSAMDNPPDAIGVFRQRLAPAPDPDTARGTWVMLDRLRNPGNVGTILRTAHAVAAAGVILVEPSCDPFAPECVRASMGSIFRVQIVSVNEDDALRLVQAWPGSTVALTADGDPDYRAPAPEPRLLIAGSEGDGLAPALQSAARRRVALPMPGGTESLNVAIATSVMLYALRFP